MLCCRFFLFLGSGAPPKSAPFTFPGGIEMTFSNICFSFLTALSLTLAGPAATAAAAAKDDKPQYTVDAIRYGTIADFAVRGLVAGADPARKMDIAMVVWLVRGNGRTILIDSGFYREQFFRQWRIRDDFRKPSEAVAAAGVKPEEITDVIVTHMHWDHADGADLFPNARIWIQRDEYTYYTGEAWHGKRTHGGIDPDDVVSYVKMNMAGRLSFVEGDGQEVIPGITCYTGGKHTYASQFAAVNTAKGMVVLASDNVYLYENLEKHVPIAATLDADSNLKAQDRMRHIAASENLIVPGHDPAIFERFRGPSKTVVRIE
jgi:glyoxylase-like metal-dependent hydrolase (beta-lactamase superfamily II)